MSADSGCDWKRLSRHGLWLILAAITCAALLVTAYAQWKQHERRKQWTAATQQFYYWTEVTDLADGKIHYYSNLNRGLDSSALLTSPRQGPFVVSNTKVQSVERSNGERTLLFKPGPLPVLPDPHRRFYILPAAKWCADVDSVIAEWDLWRKAEFGSDG